MTPLATPAQRAIGHEPTVILVTSSGPYEGKTTTIANLAASYAETGRSVLVLDCDFRRPRLHQVLGTRETPGLADVLEDAHQFKSDAEVMCETSVEGVRLVPAGTPTANPARLFNRARTLIEASRRQADIVLVDTPPYLVANDAAELIPWADAVLITVKSRRTRRGPTERMIENLDRQQAPVVGIVLVGSDDASSGYSPYYYYRANARTDKAGRRWRRMLRLGPPKHVTSSPSEADEPPVGRFRRRSRDRDPQRERGRGPPTGADGRRLRRHPARPALGPRRHPGRRARRRRGSVQPDPRPVTDVDTVVAPDDIDVGFVPQLSQDLVAMEVGAETVLLGNYGQALVLNPTAGLVWRFLDGETALADLIDDFSEVLDVDRDTVRTDIVDFARTLGRTGLLQGVAEPIDASDLAEIDWSPPEPVAVGEVIEPLALTDLDGAPATLETAPDRRVFLVNWSPGCGFCVTTAAALAAAEEGLAAAGIDLILLTTGDPDENRRVLGDAGIAAPALLRAGEDDPFAGFGTPSAYLLDADGRVEEPMAYGAVEVPARAAELAGIDLPGPDDVAAPGAVPTTEMTTIDECSISPSPAPCAVPGAGVGPEAAPTEWAGTSAYRVGAFHIGVRVNDTEVATWSTDCCPGPGYRTDELRTTSRSRSTREAGEDPVGSTCWCGTVASSSGAGRQPGRSPPS